MSSHPRPWQDPARPVEERVDLLLAEMTLAEKVGQLGSRWLGNDNPEGGGAMTDGDAPDAAERTNVAPLEDVFAAFGSEPLETDLPLRTRVRLTGLERTLGHDRRLVTPVVVGPAS